MAIFMLNTAIAIPADRRRAQPKKPSIFVRFVEALAQSRQRRAEREIRRYRAVLGEPNSRLDYAMLPFSGE